MSTVPNIWLHAAASCAGLQGVDAAAPSLLHQQLAGQWSCSSGAARPRIMQLRVFAVTAAPELTQAAAAATVAGRDGRQQPDSGGSTTDTAAAAAPDLQHTSSSDGSSAGQLPDAKGNGLLQQQPEMAWAELWVQGLTKSTLRAAAGQVVLAQQHSIPSNTTSSNSTSPIAHSEADAAAASSQTSPHTAAAASGSLAAPPPQLAAAASWWPQRSRDVAELLLSYGLARLADPEDCEWLGARQARWRAYER